MPKFQTDSKWLRHQDLTEGQDTMVTIKDFSEELVGQGGEARKKWVLTFREIEKGLALNATNGKLICKALGSEEMDEWIGRKIALYVADDIPFNGEIVSAIRVRSKSPKGKAAPVPADPNEPPPWYADTEAWTQTMQQYELKDVKRFVGVSQALGCSEPAELMQLSERQQFLEHWKATAASTV